MKGQQRELFLSEVNNRETIAAIEANNDIYCFQKRIEKFPLSCKCILEQIKLHYLADMKSLIVVIN